jgi:hypothetical protein
VITTHLMESWRRANFDARERMRHNFEVTGSKAERHMFAGEGSGDNGKAFHVESLDIETAVEDGVLTMVRIAAHGPTATKVLGRREAPSNRTYYFGGGRNDLVDTPDWMKDAARLVIDTKHHHVLDESGA